MLASVIEGARRHPSVVNSGNNPGPVDHPQGQTRTLWYLRPDGWKRKKKNHDGTRFVLSLAAVSASLTTLCVHSPLGVRDVVALETTASVVAWAFPRQGWKRSSILRSAIKLLLIVKRTLSPAICLSHQPHLLFGNTYGGPGPVHISRTIPAEPYIAFSS